MSGGSTADEQALIDRARQSMTKAYAPYSRFRVGAALVAEDGTVFDGCNVESAAFPSGTCAERAALAAAVTAGRRRFVRVVVATEAETPTSPCGMCRQALVEFAPRLEVVSITTGGAVARWTLEELLPHAFTPASMDAEGAGEGGTGGR